MQFLMFAAKSVDSNNRQQKVALQKNPLPSINFKLPLKANKCKNRKTEKAQYLRTARTGCFYSYLASQENNFPNTNSETMSRFLVLAICVLFVAVSAALVSAQSPPTVSSSSMAPPPAIVCGANAMAATSRSHLQCYSNCQNKDDPNRICPLSLHYGNFCLCKEGFIYKMGTSGDCVRPEEC
ncbi:hypothetical protein TYRP_005326 [Tyrophagus putrescentiae]|nr:hypothetical protein TYRP_005326 [Tyrophagus putrescentiae]